MTHKISKYQDSILKFLKTKSFLNETTEPTKKILLELIEESDHIPGILCLTILGKQREKCDTKVHGHYIASGIDMLMIVAKIASNRDYYRNTYGETNVNNLIMEVTVNFYKCVSQNIDTLRLSKNGVLNSKIMQLCVEYSTKMIPGIIRNENMTSEAKMKKTDLLCMTSINNEMYDLYKTKNRIDKEVIFEDIKDRYGSVCKLAMCLGWIIGQGDDGTNLKVKDLSSDKNIMKLEVLGDYIGTFLKIHDDFNNIERDIKHGKITTNYVINNGIKEAYNELIDSKANFLEESIKLKVDSKASKEIMDIIVRNVDIIVKDVSVDMDTDYDDVE
jgi:hypothetical protein